MCIHSVDMIGPEDRHQVRIGLLYQVNVLEFIGVPELPNPFGASHRPHSPGFATGLRN